MKKKLLLIIFAFLFTEVGFSQGTATYETKSKTIDVNSGVEGTVSILVKYYGSITDQSVFLETMACSFDNVGYVGLNYSDGSILSYNQKETYIKFRFKKTVSIDTQVVYKFSTNGSCFQNEADMIKITVNYKTVSTTTPTDPPSPPSNAVNPKNSRNYIYEGEIVDLDGSGMGSNMKYKWFRNIFDGNGFQIIPGATSEDYYAGNVLITTEYQREATNTVTNIVNFGSCLISVTSLPPILNNTITMSGTQITGSSPTGGLGSFDYKWYVYFSNGEDPWVFEQNNTYFTIPVSVYNFMENTGIEYAYIFRKATSSISSNSNTLVISRPQVITNNNIALSGNNILGSSPTGGIGEYNYEYYLYQEYDGEIIGEVALVGNSKNYPVGNYGGLTTKIYRKVISGYKNSNSNVITILPEGSFAKKSIISNETSSVNFAVYPNPTKEALNFITDFSTNKEIEIFIYSENLGNEKSIFKGTVTPNQVVNWRIPSNYEKGIYFYKIKSGREEIKTGKIIYQ